MLGLNFINLLVRILGFGLQILNQSILSHIAQQHHSCPNDIVISIGSFNCQCVTLLNGPIVDCIVVSSMSRTIQ